ncbi:hypothetical protein [Streptomyces sp. NPDC059611]
MPPRVRCRATEGREFSGGAPPRLNPTLAVTFALAAAAFVQADRRAAART